MENHSAAFRKITGIILLLFAGNANFPKEKSLENMWIGVMKTMESKQIL